MREAISRLSGWPCLVEVIQRIGAVAPERDAVIFATASQQPFPAKLLIAKAETA